MVVRTRTRAILRSLALQAWALSAIAYFGWHGLYGANGWIAMERAAAQKAALAGELAALGRERAAVERRVALLRPESLELDMLDERARLSLDLVQSDEVVILERR